MNKHIAKVISGGQTGVDIAAVDAAIEAGINWGGWVPKGRRMEGGVIPAKYDWFVEHESADWTPRTYANIEDAKCTLILAPLALVRSGGTRLTLDFAERLGGGRGLLVMTKRGSAAVREVRQWIREHADQRGPFFLNVAGPRASKWPEGYDLVRAFLREVFA